MVVDQRADLDAVVVQGSSAPDVHLEVDGPDSEDDADDQVAPVAARLDLGVVLCDRLQLGEFFFNQDAVHFELMLLLDQRAPGPPSSEVAPALHSRLLFHLCIMLEALLVDSPAVLELFVDHLGQSFLLTFEFLLA